LSTELQSLGSLQRLYSPPTGGQTPSTGIYSVVGLFRV
jgi:hypothetical protein